MSPPPNETYVTVDVIGEEAKFNRNHNEWEKISVKRVGNWKEFDPAMIAQRTKLIDWKRCPRVLWKPI